MSLAPVIEFRWLVAQLTDKETKAFITDFTAANPQLIIQALGALFINEPKHQNPTDTITVQCNQTISTIIRSRNSDDVDVAAVKFDSIPRRLIGHCASFLDQRSYGWLSICSRTVYLGCNTPSKLTELSVGYKLLRNNLPVDLSRFPFATNLNITNDAVSESDLPIIASQIANMTRLQSVDLSHIEWSSRFLGIIASHQETIQRTKYLSVEYEWVEDQYEFFDAIAAFKDLDFLKVNIKDDSFEWDTKSITKMCRNWTGLDFNDPYLGIERSILQQIGHRLQYLKLNSRYRVTSIGFKELRQLKQGTNCDDDAMGDVLKTAVNLEKVKMNGNTNLIEKLLKKKCKRLTYLEIDVKRGHLQRIALVLDALEESLPHTQFVHTEAIKIRVNTSSSFECLLRSSKCIKSLQRITESLSMNAVKQWMFILHIEHNEKKKKWKSSFANHLCESLRSDIVNTAVCQDNNALIVLMTNRDCSICGWRESWLTNL